MAPKPKKAKIRRKGTTLSDKERKNIVASYAELGTYAGVARKHHVSDMTVKRIVDAEPNMLEIVEHKNQENTQTVLDYMDTKTEAVQDLIETYLHALVEPEKVKSAHLSQISTALGTVIDKWTMRERGQIQQDGGQAGPPQILIVGRDELED